MEERHTIKTISAHAFIDEGEAVKRLLDAIEPLSALEAAIARRAHTYAEAIRKSASGDGMENFLQTYGLDTKEGVALMCLAESLLRIPDAETADRLIQDTFEGRNWRRLIIGNESLLVSASSWGLLFTGKIVDFGQDAENGIGNALQNLIAKIGEPAIREILKKAMRFIGSQFVLGETIQDGMENAEPWAEKGFRFSYDILGEGARSDAQAQSYITSYHQAIALVGRTAKGKSLFEADGISVKLSALHPRYHLSQEPRVMAELLPRLKTILLLAKEHNITVSIDAEEANRLDIELLLFANVVADPNFAGWNGIGFVLQAYQKRAYDVIDFLRALAEKHKRIIPLRLVKGAYWDSEIKHAQVMGLAGYPVFTRKEHTDVSYLACADKILAARCFYPQFATHNARTIASIQLLAEKYKVAKDGFEFQRLHGMGEQLHDMIVKDYPSRIYAPIGEHKDLLAYLIRRLLENGANTSFVNLLMDSGTTIEELLADPVERAKELGGRMNDAIPVPAQLYPDRKNSAGFDTGYLPDKLAIESALAAHSSEDAGRITQMTAPALTLAIGSSVKAFTAWAAQPVEHRAAIIERAADLLEGATPELMALLVQEAGKTIPDALSEIREAADFCRYYAAHARRLMENPALLPGPTGESNRLSLTARGVFGCISPWNFPLAIFTGQVVAALVTGNCAIAKPAEQTPRIAMAAVHLLHQAGVPKDVLQLAIGKGSVIGGALTGDARIAGIVFTGSVEVAQTINRSLAARTGAIVPFIAETGGMNCMVVDSSALLEQAVDDIVLSAFGSAGQRCSALRILYVQEDIADNLLTLLKGAMAELRVASPVHLDTDIGPVIDARAQEELQAHIEHMKKSGKLIAAANPAHHDGHFVLPHAFEIKSIRELEKEIFGPILHVIRFKATDMERVAHDINSTHYGLTFGMHSRVEDNIEFFVSRIHAGNHYINRSMIGAVVGVQPFGGVALSGTGPKAGGPYYLLKFLHERTLTVNTAAIGGNVTLLTAQ